MDDLAKMGTDVTKAREVFVKIKPSLEAQDFKNTNKYLEICETQIQNDLRKSQAIDLVSQFEVMMNNLQH